MVSVDILEYDFSMTTVYTSFILQKSEQCDFSSIKTKHVQIYHKSSMKEVWKEYGFSSFNYLNEAGSRVSVWGRYKEYERSVDLEYESSVFLQYEKSMIWSMKAVYSCSMEKVWNSASLQYEKSVILCEKGMKTVWLE